MKTHERLAKHIEDAGMKHIDFARKCGFDKWLLSKIVNGHRAPSLPTAAKIERATGGVIPASSWYSEEAA